MPAAFDKCVREGGRVRTKTLSKGRFIRICFPKGAPTKDGGGIAGEVKKKASITRKKK